MIKILSIFGTRPEATKMVPVVLELKNKENIISEVCVTAQHRELLDDVLAPFGIAPDYDLDLMRDRQSLSDFTARALIGLEDIIKQAQPDWVLVHGDTSTTFVASLAAFYASQSRPKKPIQIGHIEAGLRTYDKFQPYPEEMNRKLTTALADKHFAPTELARKQLLQENISADSIVVTGNTAIDLLAHTIKENYSFQNAAITTLLNSQLNSQSSLQNSLDLHNSQNLQKSANDKKHIILMTAHRRENWGTPLENICRAVRQLVTDFPEISIVYPVHPNPVVLNTAHAILSGHERIILTTPLSVFDMHNLMAKSHLILTDSGGLQEEAPALNKPVVVMRDVTERPEGEAAGTLTLAGVDEIQIHKTVSALLTDDQIYQKMAQSQNPFGDGHAAKRIVEELLC